MAEYIPVAPGHFGPCHTPEVPHRWFETEPFRCLRERWLVGDPSFPRHERRNRVEALRREPGLAFPRPTKWLWQPADVVIFGLIHFTLGATLGWFLDDRVFGPVTTEERDNRALMLWRIVAQMTLVVLAFNYTRKLLLMIQPKYGMPQYEHSPVPAMDGGFAMSLGFAWSQRYVMERFYTLVDDSPWASRNPSNQV